MVKKTAPFAIADEVGIYTANSNVADNRIWGSSTTTLGAETL